MPGTRLARIYSGWILRDQMVRIFVGPMPSKPRDGETADPIRSLLVLVKRKFMFYPVLSLFSFLAQRKLDTDATV